MTVKRPTRVKHPRTFHLPWSPGATSDDKVHDDWNVNHMFGAQEVVVTEKLDGENTTIYSDGYMHARSLDGRSHESQTWVRALAARIARDIPEGWRICGENLYAQHSLYYDSLTTYFYVFAIYNEHNRCLSWDETVEWVEAMGLEMVPVLWRGKWDVDILKRWTAEDPRLDSKVGDEAEGYVVRLVDRFAYDDFAQSTAKYVRADHITTNKHWKNQRLRPNKLTWRA